MVVSMIRTQIQLDEERMRQLKRLASESGASMAEMIRRAVDMMLASAAGPDAGALKQRVMSARGRFRSGRGDVSERHDHYLAGDFR
jgi:hypothetical protein